MRAHIITIFSIVTAIAFLFFIKDHLPFKIAYKHDQTELDIIEAKIEDIIDSKLEKFERQLVKEYELCKLYEEWDGDDDAEWEEAEMNSEWDCEKNTV